MNLWLGSSTTAVLALSAIMLMGATTGAHAVTCSASNNGTLNLYLADSCTLPTAGETKVYFDKADATMSGTGHVGSQNGTVIAKLTSSSNIDLANGFAHITGTSGNFGDLTISLPGHSFGDLVFDIKLDSFGTGRNKQTFPLTIQAYGTGGLAGTLSYAADALKANADLSFLLLASAGERFTSVVISSMFGNLNGIQSIRHLEVSEVQATTVPLPASFLLLLSAIGGFGLLGARSNRKAA